MNNSGITIKRVNVVRKNGVKPSNDANTRMRMSGVESSADWYAEAGGRTQ